MPAPTPAPAPALTSALSSLSSWLSTHPGELPDDGDTIVAIHDLLGDRPEQLRTPPFLERAATERPDLVAHLAAHGGVLAAPRDACLFSPVEAMTRRLARLEELAAPDLILDETRHQLAALSASPPPALDWHRVVHLPTAAGAWPGLARVAALTIACADHAVAVWRHHHPDDDRPLRLAADLAAAARFAPTAFDLRDQLERETYREDPALGALRAIVLAHDYLTDNPDRCEQTDLPYLCAFAWSEAPEVIPAALRSLAPDPRIACFRWWIEVAIPTAAAAAATADATTATTPT